MANIDFPHGLTPWEPNQSAARVHEYDKTTTTAVYQGDVVQMKSTGKVKTITTTTGNDAIIGVAAEYKGTASTDNKLLVYDDPDQLYEIQDDGDGMTTSDFNVKHRGATAVLVVTTGNTTTYVSKHELDMSGTGTASTDALLILDYVRGPGNSSAESHMKWIVKLNRHILKTGSGGI